MEILIEDMQMLRDSAAKYLADHQPVAAFRALRDANDPLGYSPDALREMADLGWMGLILPEENGGAVFGYRAAGLIAEEIGRNLTAVPFLSTAILAATVMRGCGGDVLARWGEKLATGECVVALAMDEGAKHRPQRIKTQANRTADGFELAGQKTFVIDGIGADRLIVTAMLDGELALFWIDPDNAAVTLRPMGLLDHRNAAVVQFDSVKLAADALMAKGDQAELIMAKALCAGRLIVAAEQLGIARECARHTGEYLQTRKQFGVVIGTFQVLQHRAADLYCEIEQTASLIASALIALDRGDEAAEKLSRAAKAKAAKTARQATEEAVQMHGGIGMTDELDLGLFMKRERVLSELLGDRGCHVEWLLRDRGL